ncbi:MAG: NAD(P)/FAD-dependent oxidoreductase [Kofleriaceae bacterium]
MTAPLDVIIIGGSYAGLSAALQLARGRRRILVIDAGERRNRFADSSHGFLTRDGDAPGTIAAIGRDQLLAYPTVTWLEGRASQAERAGDDAFAITAGGATHTARRVILAHGVADTLPEIPGIAERWGKTIFHCPYCHGYELDRGPIAVLGNHAMSHHQAMLLPDWGPTTFFLEGHVLEPDIRAALLRREVTIEEGRVTSVGGAGRIEVHLADGRTSSFAGMFLTPATRPSAPLAAQLGCASEDGPLGTFITTDATKETSTRGVFACGDIALPMGSVAFAVADGARAGFATHASLIFR